MQVNQRVEILYPAHLNENGTITCVVRRDGPSLVSVLLDSGRRFICDETMIRLLGK